jgi:hypothetical protein
VFTKLYLGVGQSGSPALRNASIYCFFTSGFLYGSVFSRWFTENFGLSFHRQTDVVPVCALTIGKTIGWSLKAG